MSEQRERLDHGDFETSFRELEAVIEKLESGDLPLQDCLQYYRRGQRLRQDCVDRLEAAQARAATLREQPPDADAGADTGVEAGHFEAEMQALEKIVQRLEQDEQPLAQGLANFEAGLARSRMLQHSLDKAEQSVRQLVREGETETLGPVADTDAGAPGTDN